MLFSMNVTFVKFEIRPENTILTRIYMMESLNIVCLRCLVLVWVGFSLFRRRSQPLSARLQLVFAQKLFAYKI